MSNLDWVLDKGEGQSPGGIECEGLRTPHIWLDPKAIFTAAPRNFVVFRAETLRWLAQFGPLELNGSQKRILAYAKEHGGFFTSRAYQELVGIDIYAASRDIKDLIRKGIVKLPQKGGRVYELLPTLAVEPVAKPFEYAMLEPVLKRKGYVKNQDIREALGISRRQAIRVAKRLVELGWLKGEGERRGRRYLPCR